MTEKNRDRCQAIDITRLYAMLAMLLVHAAYKGGIPLRVATGWDGVTPEPGPIGALLGVIFHVASPAFSLLTGFSLAYFVVSRQRKKCSEGEIDAYLLRRGVLLLFLGCLFFGVRPGSWRFTGDPGILGMFGLALWLLIPFRRLSVSHLFVLAAGLALAVQWYLGLRGDPGRPSWLEAILLTTDCCGGLYFPLLPWLPVILLGFASGRLTAEKRLSLESLGLSLGGLLLVLWGSLYVSGLPLPFRKFPPSPDYLLPYLAATYLLLALHARFRSPENWWFYRRFLFLSRCSLVFYVLHARVILNGLTLVVLPLGLPAPVNAVLLALLALGILLPVCAFSLWGGPLLGALCREMVAGVIPPGRRRRGTPVAWRSLPERRPAQEGAATVTSLPSEVAASLPSSPG